jgi:mercuric ion transport protein
MGEKWSSTGSMTVALLSAILGSLCCIPAGAMLAMGLARGWISGLEVFAPFRPVFVSVAMMCLGVAFYHTHLVGHRPSMFREVHPADRRRRQRVTFWLVALLIVTLIALPLLLGQQV